MATPEQNALLAMQLFSPVAEQFNAQNDARTNLLYKLTMANRDEQLKRELTAGQDARAYKLAEMQAGRDDKRNQATLDWHKNADAARERAAGVTATARDKADLTNEFDREYQKYADAAGAAELPVKKREDFPETRAGLGQMQAETSAAARAYRQNSLKRAATSGAQGILRLQTDLKRLDDDIISLEKPTPADEKVARARAVAAVRSEVTNDATGAYKKLATAAKEKGFDALAKGDTDIAAEFLGPQAILTYETNYEQTLMGLPNMKARMAAVAAAKRNRQTIQGFHEKMLSGFIGASGTNEFIPEELQKLTPLQQMQVAPPPGGRSDEDKFGARTPRVGTYSAAEEAQLSARTPGSGGFGFGGVPVSGGVPPAPTQAANWFGFGGVPAGPAAVQPIIPTALPPDLMESLRKVKTPRLDPQVRRQEIQSQMDSLVQQYGQDAYFTPEYMRLSAELMRSGR